MRRALRVGLLLFALVSTVVGLGVLSSCGNAKGGAGEISGPTTISPSPSASASPSFDRCKPTSCEINGEGLVCGIGEFQPRRVTLLVRDATRTPINNECVFPREASWSHNGPLRRFGPRDGYAFDYWAESSGDAVITATLSGVSPLVKCSFDVHISESCR